MADAPALKTCITENELMALGSEARVEVVNGEIVEMSPVGEEHQIIVSNLYDILRPFAKQHRLGPVYSDSLIFILRPEEKGLRSARVPAVSFIRKEILPPGRDKKRPLRIAPTLAIEVISPDEDPVDILKKAREFLDAGTEQVWLVYPSVREVHVYQRGSQDVKTYRGEAAIDVSALFPGLALMLDNIFVTSEWD